jgi:hypothetical protein
MEEKGRFKLIADVALFSGDRVLLVKYKDTHKYDQQAGGFLPDDEPLHGRGVRSRRGAGPIGERPGEMKDQVPGLIAFE